MARSVQLFTLPQELNDCVYTAEQYPLLVDPTGQAVQFLKYRSRYLSIFKKGDFDKETLRKALVQALHNGAWLVIDFSSLECELFSLFDDEHFPAAVLSPQAIFEEETYMRLLRPGDEFAAKVTYEHMAALANGAFQDRTKAHAPERVADVDRSFDPKGGFRIIVATSREEPPADLAERMCVMRIEVSAQQVKDNAGVWGAGGKPRKQKSREQVKLDNELLECAEDGDLDAIRELVEQKGADVEAKDGRGCTPLSEAAVQGHLEVVRYFLDWKAPIGTDPNSPGDKGRTPLHRAAFKGYVEVTQLLLERGSDPRVKDLNGETAFDLASNDETRAALESWDVAKTESLLEARAAAVAEEEEKQVRSEEDRLALEKRRKTQKLLELTEAGDKDSLEMELLDCEPGTYASYRDDRGNSVLHVAAIHGRLECVTMLIDELRMEVNLREGKGWTPVAIAAFHGHKKVCQALMERRADPSAANAYRKSAYDVAKDDEIRAVLRDGADGLSGGAGASAEASAAAASSAGEGAGARGPSPKAKGKARAKSTGKAKAKARGKSRPR